MTGFSAPMSDVAAPDQRPPVIVLGVDTPIGVAILRDLGRHNYCTIGIGRSRSSIGFASRFCHHAEIRASSESTLITQLQQLASRFPGAAVLAVSENDNLIINRHRHELEGTLTIIAPEQAMLDQVLDKSRSIDLARLAGIRVPHSFEPQSMEEIEQSAPGLSYPRVIKWSNPNDVVEALQTAGLTLHKCEYAHSATELIDKLRPYAGINKFPLVQEYCPGKGIGQMFLVREGEILLQFQHQRVHEWPPEGGVSTLCKSLPLNMHQACRVRSETLLKNLRWTGVAMVEYRYSQDTDTYYFMEINGRFWGSLPLAIAAGVPFAAGLVQSTKKSAPTIKQPEYAELYCRFMIPEIRRLARLLFQSNQIQDPYYHYSRLREFLSFIFYFFRPGTRYYLFSIRDPGPFMADLKNIVAKVLFRSS